MTEIIGCAILIVQSLFAFGGIFTKIVFPPEYQHFHCVADACPDSCCTDWEIVLDEDTESYYQTVSGSLGERLRSKMVIDEDGDTIFQKRHGNCPFWNQKHLCDIQTELGEEALCETCRLFPRITQDYGDFVEYDISIACPEAARLLLSRTPKSLCLIAENRSELSGDSPVYELKWMQKLQMQREMLFQLLRNTSCSATVQLAECLRLSCQWENLLLEYSTASTPDTSCLTFLQSCNILTEDWRNTLEQASTSAECSFTLDKALDHEIRAFAFDFLYRHYLRAVFKDTALLSVHEAAFSVCAVLTIIQRLHLENREKRLRIWQLFVKEVEYDSSNLDRLEWTLETKHDFASGTLFQMLLQA